MFAEIEKIPGAGPAFPMSHEPWQPREPMRHAGKRGHHVNQTRTRASSGEGCKVLLVEDDPAVAELYATVLRLEGYDVTISVDGLTGLEAIRSGNFDVILLDIRMPRMDGLAMLRAAIGEPSAQGKPVLILTNYDDPNLRRQALDLGARDYLLKSRTMPKDLAAQVARLCG